MNRPAKCVLMMAAILVFACGKPTPDKVCDHAVGVSPGLDKKECLAMLANAQKIDADLRDTCSKLKTPEPWCSDPPAVYAKLSKCLMDAQNDGTVRGCTSNQDALKRAH